MSRWDAHVDLNAPGHQKGVTSEQATRRALGAIHGWDNKKAPKTQRPKLSLKAAVRKTPTKIDKQNYPLSPDMAEAMHLKAPQNIPVALPAGTKLNVWWSGEEEPYECEVKEWRLISDEDGSLPPTYVHRCEYEGGIFEHDLRQIIFEVVPGTMRIEEPKPSTFAALEGFRAPLPRDTLAVSASEGLPPPSSPLKGSVLARGAKAVWEDPALATPARKTSEEHELEQLELLQHSIEKLPNAVTPEATVTAATPESKDHLELIC